MKITLSQVLPKLQQVKEYEKYYSALCPFHDDTKPSFLLFKDGWFKCLGCGKSGDLHTLHKVLHGWTTTSHRIKQEVTDYHIPPIPTNSEYFAMDAHETLVRFSESLAWYLRLRGIDDQILPQKIGWYNGWYTFPTYDYDDAYKGMVLRAGQHIQQATGLRYVIKSTAGLYFPDWYLARKGDYLVITFGILDAITLTKMRIPAASSIYGKTVNLNLLDWVRKPIVFFPDKDEEGKARDMYRKLGWRGRVVEYPYQEGLKDPNDLYLAGYGQSMINSIRSVL